MNESTPNSVASSKLSAPSVGQACRAQSYAPLFEPGGAGVAAGKADTVRLLEICTALDHHSIVAFTDAKGVITDVNDAFERISGYSRGELIGQTHRIINSGHHPRSFFADMWRTIAGGKIWKGEVCNRAKGGDLYWVLTTIMPLGAGAGQPAGYLAIRTDITELKRAQREIEQRNRDMEQFVYTVSHDLKSPIVTIGGYLGHMSRSIESLGHEELAHDLSRVRRAAERMGACVEDLLNFSRVGHLPLKPRPIDLPALLAEISEALAADIADGHAEITSAFAISRIIFDRTLLTHLAQNLIQNAIRHGRVDGRVRVQVESRLADDGAVQLIVRDHGPGIPAPMRERVFGLFQRLNIEHEGTGVGLAIVRNIAERVGGRISIEETPGGGATFVVTLPASVLPERHPAPERIAP